MNSLIKTLVFILCFLTNINFLSSQIFLFTFEGETEVVTIENAIGTPFISTVGTLTDRNYPEGANSSCVSTSGTDSRSHSNWQTGEAYRFSVNTTGFSDMLFSVCIRASNTTINNFILRASNDDINWTTIVPEFSPMTSYQQVAGALPASMNNQALVYIEIYKTDDADDAIVNIRIDNAQLTGVLPVELIDFKARESENFIHLSWQTATEINNDFFTIQHSLDGRTFYDLKTIAGAGNSYETKSYSFVHENPFEGLNYYRLKQTDFDGRENISSVESIQFGNNESWSIYPNPAKDHLTINLPEPADQNIAIYIYDLQGKLLEQFFFAGELSQFNLPVNGLPQGQYFLKILTNHQVSSHLFFKS